MPNAKLILALALWLPLAAALAGCDEVTEVAAKVRGGDGGASASAESGGTGASDANVFLC